MDVSLLLNASDSEYGSQDDPGAATPRLSTQGYPISSCPASSITDLEQRYPRIQASNTINQDHPTWGAESLPLPASDRTTSAASSAIAQSGRGRSVQPVNPLLTRRNQLRNNEELSLMGMKELDLGSENKRSDDGITPSMEDDQHRRHKLSDSQSSVSPWASSLSGARSRTSVTTMVGDEHSVQPTINDIPPEETKPATVREEVLDRPPDHCRYSDLGSSGLESSATGSLSDESSSFFTAATTQGSLHKTTVPAPSPIATFTHSTSISRKRETKTLHNLSKMSGSRPATAAIHSAFIDEDGPFSEMRYKTRAKVGEVEYFAKASASNASANVSPQDPNFSTSAQSGESSSRPSPCSPSNNDESDTKAAPQNELKCMFTESCDTGAQLRKAISHFFGRNKSCTLKIPPHVWVHYCRKHYQRIRYRNAKDYAIIQIDLVRMQVEILQEWSQKNQESGHGRYIKDWALALRKREQQRLEELGAAVAENSLIPQWVYDSLGGGYTTEQILAMVGRFRAGLVSKALEDIPEIEFLPDIVGVSNDDQGKTTKTRSQGKRKASHADIHQSTLLQIHHDLESHAQDSWETRPVPVKRVRPNQINNGHDCGVPYFTNTSSALSRPYGYPIQDRGYGQLLERHLPTDVSSNAVRQGTVCQEVSVVDSPLTTDPQGASTWANNHNLDSGSPHPGANQSVRVHPNYSLRSEVQNTHNSILSPVSEFQEPVHLDNWPRVNTSSQQLLPPIYEVDMGASNQVAAMQGDVSRLAHQRSASSFSSSTPPYSSSGRPSNAGFPSSVAERWPAADGYSAHHINMVPGSGARNYSLVQFSSDPTTSPMSRGWYGPSTREVGMDTAQGLPRRNEPWRPPVRQWSGDELYYEPQHPSTVQPSSRFAPKSTGGAVHTSQQPTTNHSSRLLPARQATSGPVARDPMAVMSSTSPSGYSASEKSESEQ